MSHLIRAGLALALAAAVFLGVRTLVLQGTLSQPGLALRPPLREENIGQWQSKPLQFLDSEGCAGSRCHQDAFDLWAKSAHGGVSCETCHGAAKAHAEDTSIPVPADLEPELCTLCHAKVMGRPPGFPQVDADHYSESACTSCHKSHQPGPPRAISHEVSEGSDCLSCHSPTDPPERAVPRDHIDLTNERCLTCHEQKR